MRTESGNFDIVSAAGRGIWKPYRQRHKELLLIIEAGTPGQIGPDLQVFAYALADHVLRVHSFGRLT